MAHGRIPGCRDAVPGPFPGGSLRSGSTQGKGDIRIARFGISFAAAASDRDILLAGQQEVAGVA